MATKKTTAQGAPKQTRGRRTKPKPDMNQKWSILLFGVGAVLLMMTWVQGSALWAWIRVNILFGVFGISTYLVGPLMLYVALLVALELPMKVKLAKGFLLLMIVSGVFLVFSGEDLSALSFQEGIVHLLHSGANAWGLGGGLISSVFGWSLLALCGRPAANILLVILLIVGIMFITGITPADLYYFCSGRAKRVKNDLDKRVQIRQEQTAAQREADAAAPAQRGWNTAARRKQKNFNVDLGPDTVSGSEIPPQEKPEIGPGGTFGMYMPNETAPYDAVDPAGAPTSCTAPITQTQVQSEDAPFVHETPAPIAELVKKAAGARAEITVDGNDQLTIVPANGGPEGYTYPPLSLFQKQKHVDETNVEAELTHNADLLVKTLASFGVQTRILDISRGPSVTRYELQPLAGVKISRITGLADDIALNLAATGVRIEAPIPGKAAVGIEVPNKHGASVNIRSILEAPVFAQSTSPITMALGKDIAGKCWAWDLAKMPHVLIAGSTGSGKSVCINAIIMSFLYKSSPEDLKLIMIDPKMVELSDYNGIPHLMMPVVTEARKAAGALGAAVGEMEKRYHAFAEYGVRNIEAYNQLALKATDALEKMPYIAIIIDELADLMMVAGKEVEEYICRIAQKARAAGMHLIVATQRPSVDVITGLIKANIPSRIAFAVSSQIDSRTILDGAGAEKLLGKGDMLFMPVGASKPTRIQGTYVQDEEIKAVQDFIKKYASASYNEEMIQEMEKRAVPEKGVDSADDTDDCADPMFKTAVEVVIEAGQASTSFLQRRCKLGYARAARLIDEMEQQHIIGPADGSKPRQVLISRQQWIEMTMQHTEDTASDFT